MKLILEFPREPKECNPNCTSFYHAKRRAVKHARDVGRLYAEEAMRRAGITPGTMQPRYLYLLTRWFGHNTDVDNALASMKAYQDGVFDALQANDREIVCAASAKVRCEGKGGHKTHRYALCETEEEFFDEIRGYAHDGGLV